MTLFHMSDFNLYLSTVYRMHDDEENPSESVVAEMIKSLDDETIKLMEKFIQVKFPYDLDLKKLIEQIFSFVEILLSQNSFIDVFIKNTKYIFNVEDKFTTDSYEVTMHRDFGDFLLRKLEKNVVSKINVFDELSEEVTAMWDILEIEKGGRFFDVINIW